MKKLLFAFLFVVCLIGLLLWMATPAQATPTQLLTVTVNNTTNTVTSFQMLSYNPTPQNFTIYHGGLATTNALTIYIYANYQGATTNGRVILGVWNPTFTNAGTETIIGANYTPTNWLSVDVGTTNSVQVNGSYGQ